MNTKKVEALLEKYWSGESNQEEELELKRHFSSEEGSSHQDAAFFNYTSEKSDLQVLDSSFDDEILYKITGKPAASKSRKLVVNYWYAAASIVILLSIGIIFKNTVIHHDPPQAAVVVDTYEDPQKAFEETKKALLFLSSKLNQSSEYATQLSKFEQTQEVIKQN